MDGEEGRIVSGTDAGGVPDPFKKIRFKRRGGLALFAPITLSPLHDLGPVLDVDISRRTPEERQGA
jgi:hypothetical protein